MSELWNDIGQKLGDLVGKWTGYAAFGSFLLYLLGYLALRFQLSVYGVATDIDAFDEKYLFAGCRFVVYLFSTVPSVLILLLVLAAIGYVPYKAIPSSIRNSVKGWVSRWCAEPAHLLLFGIVFAVLFIQMVMRKCFAFVGSLLFLKNLPNVWISRVLLSGEGRLGFYFSGLVAGTMLTGAILFYVMRCDTATTTASRALIWLLCFLFAVEFLFLPVNYGVLISTQSLPRITEISGDMATSGGRVSWLLWDSKDAITYLVRDQDDQRTLVTMPRKDAKIRIVSYDNIVCVLFCGKQLGGPLP